MHRFIFILFTLRFATIRVPISDTESYIFGCNATNFVQHFFSKTIYFKSTLDLDRGLHTEQSRSLYLYFCFHFECSLRAISQKAWDAFENGPQLKPTLFLDFHCSVGGHSTEEKGRRKALIGYWVFVMRSSLNEWMYEWRKLREKLTQSPESVPTGRPGSLCFVSLPSGAGRGRRWSTQPRWALRKNLQILIKRHIAGWKADVVKLSGFMGFFFCLFGFFFRSNAGKDAALLSVLVY